MSIDEAISELAQLLSIGSAAVARIAESLGFEHDSALAKKLNEIQSIVSRLERINSHVRMSLSK